MPHDATDLYIDDKFGWRACVRMRQGRGGQFDGVEYRLRWEIAALYLGIYIYRSVE